MTGLQVKGKCIHAKNSCPECSMVKMVCYDANGNKKVWYSFIKEEEKVTDLPQLAENMFNRLQKKGLQTISKVLFYNNHASIDSDAFMQYP
ncbi:hypothetical protein MG296_10695 [Flavobacteriaceae bacterium TK19130]|nr:hypothetical protein [Thermobacterium salinum]